MRSAPGWEVLTWCGGGGAVQVVGWRRAWCGHGAAVANLALTLTLTLTLTLALTLALALALALTLTLSLTLINRDGKRTGC